LPFEPDWYKARGIHHVRFVGHPLVGEVSPRHNRQEFCQRHDLDSSRPIITLLPGSRHKELERILPLMIATAAEMARVRDDVQFVIALAASRTRAEVERCIKLYRQSASSLPEILRVVQNETRDALAVADAAAVASGTATLEAALLDTPLVIVYKESALNWHTLGRLVHVEHYGLVNLIAGERIVSELLQDDFTPARLAAELFSLIEPERNAWVRGRLRAGVKRLGDYGASLRAADVIRQALCTWTSN
jgi:lipid-A-disaccharide synthase